MNKSTAYSILASLLVLSGCVQKMGEQGHYRAYDLPPRAQPEGTIPYISLKIEKAQKPNQLTRAKLIRGQQRFNIYCSACHGYAGYGDGMVVQRGFLPPPSYHTERLRHETDEHFFDVMTQGSGAMYSYSDKLTESDRWAVVAYIRALQLSQNSRISDFPPGTVPAELSQ